MTHAQFVGGPEDGKRRYLGEGVVGAEQLAALNDFRFGYYAAHDPQDYAEDGAVLFHFVAPETPPPVGSALQALLRQFPYESLARDVNTRARQLTNGVAFAVEELTGRPLTNHFREKIDKHFAEGVSETRLAAVIDLIAAEYPELR